MIHPLFWLAFSAVAAFNGLLWWYLLTLVWIGEF